MSELTRLSEAIDRASKDLEVHISECIIAEEAMDKARVALIMAESAKKKSRLEVKLYQERLDSLKEQAWNIRKEASL